MVDNPRHEALRQALEVVRRQAEQLATALDEPFRRFTGSAVWVGPAAGRFGEELSRHRQRLRDQAAKVTRELEEELGRTPREVSPAAARRESLGRG
ncbi:hypothetical protein Nocox_35985 [Nonomuraea coxensis DSM 45129]|uniref:Uncharacterized protein n=1 Tax=Nonomuraea coxensis DSM 45129 TaxID=1122611 RepID=A0ABX8UBE5_9ACTN|nr:hypothetical protein [Nonomuraea coxensis]QYC44756.1 hypothetical protein Nocox_35985 [Nonomuraea coxensis DSM 45129]